MNKKKKIMFWGMLALLPLLCPAIEIAKVDGSKWYKDQSPEKSMDGKLETAYVGIGEKSEITYSFKKLERLSRIMVTFSAKSWHRPKKSSVSIQLQDGSWKTIKKFDNIPKPTELIDLQVPIISKAIKLEANIMSQSKNFCILEIRFN